MERRIDGAASTQPLLHGVPAEMVVWTTRGDGIDHVRSRTVLTPRPAAGQILVRVSAVSLNYRDLLVITGQPGWAPTEDVVPTSDAVGEVVAVGPAVTRFRLGDRVLGAFLPKWRSGPLTADTSTSPIGGPTNRGMLAQYVVFDQEEAVRAPATLPDAQAAALPVAGVTAWHAVMHRCRVRSGDSVLIHGTGSVALLALQLVTALGATAIVTSSSAEKLAAAQTLGAEHVIDRRTTPDIADAVLELTAGIGVDHAIETVGGSNLNTSLRATRIGGTIAFIGLIAGLTADINTYEFVTKNISLQGIETGSVAMLEELVQFVDDRRITPTIDRIIPATEAVRGLHELQAGHTFGKVVLTLQHTAAPS